MTKHTFKLADIEGDAPPLEGEIEITEHGVTIYFHGFSTFTEDPDFGSPVYIENRRGVPTVIVWGDIQQEDPTDIISLDKASSDRALGQDDDTP